MAEEITSEARRNAIDAAVRAAAQAVAMGQEESKNFQWKKKEITLPVAKVALEYVLLNPRSHRIRAQIESLEESTAAIIESDPYGTEAQSLIKDILASTDGYERVRNAIDRDGQLEAGVLTEAGVLINANTRAVVLQELGEPYIRVNVLPSDATVKELNEIELQLQMAIDVKQPYTLTSSLLFIEDLIFANVPTAEIGRQLRKDLTDSRADRKKATEHVELELRLLSLIRDVISTSNKKLKLTFFDDKRQALIEIDQDYQSTKNSKPEEAARVRDAQLTGLLTGVDYRKLRVIDKRLIDEYLRPAMAEDSLLAEKLDALLTPPTKSEVPEESSALSGLDFLDDDSDSPVDGEEVSLSTLFNLLASTDIEGSIILPGDNEDEAVARKTLVGAVCGAILVAIDNKILDDSAGDYLQAPIKLLRNAARAIDKSMTAFEVVRNNTEFDSDAFERAYETLERALEALNLSRTEKLSSVETQMPLIDE